MGQQGGYYYNTAMQPQRPPQMAPQGERQGNAPTQGTANSGAKPGSSSPGTTKIPRLNPDAGKNLGKKGEKTPQATDHEQVLQSFLLKDLTSEDFQMETASAAIFTLIIGISFLDIQTLSINQDIIFARFHGGILRMFADLLSHETPKEDWEKAKYGS